MTRTRIAILILMMRSSQDIRRRSACYSEHEFEGVDENDKGGVLKLAVKRQFK